MQNRSDSLSVQEKRFTLKIRITDYHGGRFVKWEMATVTAADRLPGLSKGERRACDDVGGLKERKKKIGGEIRAVDPDRRCR